MRSEWTAGVGDTGTGAEWGQKGLTSPQRVTLLWIRLNFHIFQPPDSPCRKSQSLSIFIKPDETSSLWGGKCFIILSFQLLGDI